MPSYKFITCLALVVFATACAEQPPTSYSDAQKESIIVTTADEVTYQPLNPARGDASPQAGVLWGDITKDVPS